MVFSILKTASDFLHLIAIFRW